MTDRSYDVLFSGELTAGADPALVRQRLAALFRIDAAAVERLFTGAPLVIRKAVEESVAMRYQQAMRQAGAVCTLREVAPAEETAAPSGEPASEAFAPDLASAILLPPGTPFPPVPAVCPPSFDFSALTLAEAGVDLVAPRTVVPAPVPDVSGISLAPLDDPKTKVES